jgi:hypothetical protein
MLDHLAITIFKLVLMARYKRMEWGLSKPTAAVARIGAENATCGDCVGAYERAAARPIKPQYVLFSCLKQDKRSALKASLPLAQYSHCSTYRAETILYVDQRQRLCIMLQIACAMEKQEANRGAPKDTRLRKSKCHGE